MIVIYLDILDPERKELFLKLKDAVGKGVLAGGTALSLQLRHRYSLDFDIFFSKHVIRKIFKKASETLGVKEKRWESSNLITFLTNQGIQVTLVYYEFPSLYPLVETESIPLFHYRDIAADKAYVLGRRPAWRDYVDLFFLLKGEWVTLKDLIKDAQRKFKVEFAPKLFLGQLGYFGDIVDFKAEFIREKYSSREIQKFLKNEVLRYTKKNLLKGV